MEFISIIGVILCLSLLSVHTISNKICYRKLSERLDLLQMEQEKLNFRMFVIEKKQIILQERKKIS